MEIRLGGEEVDVVDQLIESAETADLESIAKEQALVNIRLEKRGRHLVTVIELSEDDAKKIDLKSIAKELKRRLAAGGTLKDNRIEVQGDHRGKVKKLLAEMGFRNENIFIDQDVHIV